MNRTFISGFISGSPAPGAWGARCGSPTPAAVPTWTAITAEIGSERSGPVVGVGLGRYGRHTGVSFSGLFNVGGGRRTYYSYRLDLLIEDTASGQRIFEGRSVTSGQGADMGAVMPYLVAALFENFPGNSGETIRVELPVD